MKGVMTLNNLSIFRVNTLFYPRDTAIRVFGSSFEEAGPYLIFRLPIPESEVYEKFNYLLEARE
ncbi:MAG TPA: hypothetical protein ENN60_02955 [archaeon]|nr:hypothetical protein [archaeon]